jgi:putative transport protein
MPVLFRVKISDEEADFRKESHRSRIEIITKCVEITNKELDGKTLIQLNFAATTGTIISRILHKNKVLIPGADTSLHTGDIVRLVGNSEKIEAAIPYLGHESEQGCPEASYFGSQKFVVTNKDIVGKSLAELHLYAYYQVNITRIRRGGVEFVAEPHHKLQWGDRVRVAGDAEQMEKVKKLFGDEMKKLESGDIFSILFGILLGIAVGLIPFSIGKVISFNLGLTGGVLLAGIFLSNRGKIGPVIWQVPVPIITFMRELGLTLFLSVVGIKAGAQVFETFQHQGLKLLLTGAAITLIPMMITAMVARVKYKMMLIELFGMLSGGMTSTPGLAAGTGMTSLQRPLIIYATVYPVAMILMMFWTKILALF